MNYEWAHQPSQTAVFGVSEEASYPILVLHDVIPDGRQCGPFAVVGGPHSTALVGFEFAHWEGKRSDRQAG